MNITDKTIFVFEGITYIFGNDDKPNKEIRGLFFTDDNNVVIIHQDGTSSIRSIQSVDEKDYYNILVQGLPVLLV